jgi:hypothetical protein
MRLWPAERLLVVSDGQKIAYCSTRLVPAYQVNDQMRQPNRYRSHAYPLNPMGDIQVCICYEGTQNDKGAGTQGDPHQTGQQQYALNIKTASLNLLLQRRQFNASLDRCQSLAMNHLSPRILQPLPKPRITDQRYQNNCSFHVTLSLSPLYTHDRGKWLQRTIKKPRATEVGIQEY